MRKHQRKSVLALLLTILLLLSSCVSDTKKAAGEMAQPETTDLEVYFFDAGKADAILLTTENGTVLIDAGEKGFGKTILAHLEEKGIDKIDYLIITHFDQDHVGGAAKVINNITVETVLQSNCPKDSEEYEKYVKALDNAGLEAATVQETCVFTLDGVAYTVDPPRQSRYSSDNSNNSSLIVTVRNGENNFLFTGDAQTERLEEFLDSSWDTYDVLKIPHHGKDEPLLGALIESTKPAYAVITSSDEEPESTATVELLEQAGAEVLLTREGAVTFNSNGVNIEVLSRQNNSAE